MPKSSEIQELTPTQVMWEEPGSRRSGKPKNHVRHDALHKNPGRWMLWARKAGTKKSAERLRDILRRTDTEYEVAVRRDPTVKDNYKVYVRFMPKVTPAANDRKSSANVASVKQGNGYYVRNPVTCTVCGVEVKGNAGLFQHMRKHNQDTGLQVSHPKVTVVSPVVKHGTMAGYKTHQRQGQRPCDSCRAWGYKYKRAVRSNTRSEIARLRSAQVSVA